MTSENEKQAIELGKIWMKNSMSRGHGYDHAGNVEENALCILKSMKADGKANGEIDSSMVSLAAWWHDAYKARLKRPRILSFLLEGFLSEKIARKELSGLVPESRLRIIRKAIRYHHLPVFFYIMRWRHPVLSQVLIEADGIEDLNYGRKLEQLKTLKHPLLRILYRIHNRMMIKILKGIAVSGYTRGIIDELGV